MIDSSGMAGGFVVKVPSSLSNRKIFLHEEKFNVEWPTKIGRYNNRDGINAAFPVGKSLFAGGFLQNKNEIIDSYLVNLNEASGNVIWAKPYTSKNESRDSVIDTLIHSSDNGILIEGVRNSKRGTSEGSKSYGNPLTGDAVVMYFSQDQIISKLVPRKNGSAKTYFGN